MQCSYPCTLTRQRAPIPVDANHEPRIIHTCPRPGLHRGPMEHCGDHLFCSAGLETRGAPPFGSPRGAGFPPVGHAASPAPRGSHMCGYWRPVQAPGLRYWCTPLALPRQRLPLAANAAGAVADGCCWRGRNSLRLAAAAAAGAAGLQYRYRTDATGVSCRRCQRRRGYCCWCCSSWHRWDAVQGLLASTAGLTPGAGAGRCCSPGGAARILLASAAGLTPGAGAGRCCSPGGAARILLASAAGLTPGAGAGRCCSPGGAARILLASAAGLTPGAGAGRCRSLPV